jgi:hypothetical protein
MVRIPKALKIFLFALGGLVGIVLLQPKLPVIRRLARSVRNGCCVERLNALSTYCGHSRSRLSFLAGFFQIAPGFFDDLFQITNAFLRFSFGLIFQPFGLLRFAANELTGLLLDLAANALCCAFNLILVHDECLHSIDDSHRPKSLEIRQLPT